MSRSTQAVYIESLENIARKLEAVLAVMDEKQIRIYYDEIKTTLADLRAQTKETK